MVEAAVPIRTSFWTPSFRTLFTGQAISSFGDWMATVAMIALVHELTGSATAVGGVLVVRLLPTVIGGPVAARITARWSAKRTMLVMDAVRIPVVLVIPWIEAWWWIYLWAFVADLAGLLFLPARDAEVPELVGPNGDLAVANGLMLGSSYGMIPIGAAGFAVATWACDQVGISNSAVIVFAINAGTFAISWLTISRLPDRAATPTDLGADDLPTFRAALRSSLVRGLGPVAAAVAGGLGALFTVGVIWVTDVLGASDVEFGVLVGCFGAGAAAGLLLLRAVDRRDLAFIRMLLIVQGAVVATMSLTPELLLALLGAVGFGATASATLAASMELVQRRLHDRQRVLVFTAFHVIIRAALAIAAIAAGIAVDLFDRTTWPLVGALESAQVVLLASGALVVLMAVTAGHRTERRVPSE